MQWEEAEPLEVPAGLAWVILTGHLTLLGKMAHDCLVSIQTVPGCIGVGETIKGVTVSGIDGIEPRLFDREPTGRHD